MLTEVLILLCSLALFVYVMMWARSSRGLPPGPLHLPVIGSPSLLNTRSHIHEILARTAKTYGDLITVYFPGRRAVVINSATVAREALVTQKDAFSGRPELFVYYCLYRGGKGFINFSPTLVLTRKIVLSAFRLYQPQLEGKITDEATKISDRFQTYDNKPFDPNTDLSLAIVNVIYAIIFDESYGLDDEEFMESMKHDAITIKLLAPTSILNLFPWLFHFPIPQTRQLHAVMANRAKVRDARFYKCKETFQQNNIRHLVDALLQAKLDEERDDVNSRHMMTDDDIMPIIDFLFGAGSETSATTLRWLLAYILNYPKIQEHLHQELNQVFGSNGQVRLKNRGNCHFLEATLTEVHRCASVAPIVPRKTTCDTQLCGYSIPKDTMVLMNYWAINHDEREWDKPHEFNPSRFLDANGEFTGTTKMSYMPFGAGRRMCIAESVAKTELFLMAATLLQKFKFENPPGCAPPELNDGVLGLSFAPKPFKIVAKPRI